MSPEDAATPKTASYQDIGNSIENCEEIEQIEVFGPLSLIKDRTPNWSWENKIIMLKMYLFRFGHNFFDIDPFLMEFIPLESAHCQLPKTTNFVKNGSTSKKLWPNRDRHIFNLNILLDLPSNNAPISAVLKSQKIMSVPHAPRKLKFDPALAGGAY